MSVDIAGLIVLRRKSKFERQSVLVTARISIDKHVITVYSVDYLCSSLCGDDKSLMSNR